LLEISYMNQYDLNLLQIYQHIILYAKLIINYYIYDVLLYDICNVTMFMNYSLYMLLSCFSPSDILTRIRRLFVC
jgi:hypothetical protein